MNNNIAVQYANEACYLSSINIVQNEVQFIGCLEGKVESDKERVTDVSNEYVSLCHDVFHFILLDNVRLVEYLDSV